ncbi:hypothetical protein J8L70_12345 [Pseudoalteromonas sp. MMG010]|uniref:hypothetical protein n=1 Tax=Pseudoalteromonas sp. MMG010 TaxID=2822685 RepID=UPI001B3A0093|nr:hypothetical protein [Pseudoalteromonas sp. MMG010]MBQ4834034.1 hypothetical protein [Pseudoalteromonas sp. MMG010]
MRFYITWLVAACSLFQGTSYAKGVDISGYARVVTGYLNVEDTDYEGYSDSISGSPDSLFAIQAQYQFVKGLELTGQLVLKPNNTTDQDGSGLEWLYLTYRPTEQLQFKLGKLRTPFFSMSDFADVGFAYPWISPPRQVYDTYLFDTFNGIDATYKFSTPLFDASVEGYFGQESGQLDIGPINTDFSAKRIFGVIGKVNIENFEVRLSNYTAELNLYRDSLFSFRDLLVSLNFNESADLLQTEGRAAVKQFGLSYDNLDYFARAEWIKITSSLDLVSDISSYYLSGGVNINNLTFHLTFADSDVDLPTPSGTQLIPMGVSDDLDFIASEYLAIFDRSKPDALQSWTAGVRWDVLPNLALKFEASTLKGAGGYNSFFINDNGKTVTKGELFLFAVDWVY